MNICTGHHLFHIINLNYKLIFKLRKWHCWVSNEGGRNLFQLFKKVGTSKQHFDELKELVGDSPQYKKM